jgi:hypothetical protein
VTTEETLAFILRVLRCFNGIDAAYHEWLWWRTDGKYAPVMFLVCCNDTFYYASSDVDRLMPDNISLLEETIADIKREVGDGDEEAWGVYVPVLFCARIRKMRPIRAAYPSNAKIAAMLDACGPPRTGKEETWWLQKDEA